MSIDTDIVDKIISISAAVPGINYAKFDEVKLAIDDFEDHEIPAIQLWDNGRSGKHSQGRILYNWSLSLELIMRSQTTDVVDQKALFEKMREIKLALWDKPNLLIPGVVQLNYVAEVTDLHLLKPNYIGRLDFEVQFYDELVSAC